MWATGKLNLLQNRLQTYSLNSKSLLRISTKLFFLISQMHPENSIQTKIYFRKFRLFSTRNQFKLNFYDKKIFVNQIYYHNTFFIIFLIIFHLTLIKSVKKQQKGNTIIKFSSYIKSSKQIFNYELLILYVDEGLINCIGNLIES